MNDRVTEVVDSVFGHATHLKQRLSRGETPGLAAEQAIFQQWLATPIDPTTQTDSATDHDIRYVLACWLDEIFILDSIWGRSWNERKLEVTVFNSNNRAWQFWEKARRALSHSELDLLEVCYLAVMLGFRGELIERLDELTNWSSEARLQLQNAQRQSWTPPLSVEVKTNVPPLRQRERLRAMVFQSGMAIVFILPIVIFFLVRQFRR